MARGNIVGMMKCEIVSSYFVSESNPDLVMNFQVVIPDPIMVLPSCITSDGPYAGNNNGLYEGFIFSTYCAYMGTNHQENEYRMCRQNFTGKLHFITLKELIKQGWVFSGEAGWFYKVSSN